MLDLRRENWRKRAISGVKGWAFWFSWCRIWRFWSGKIEMSKESVVVDLDVEKADRAGTSLGIKPETVLKAALRDCEEWGDATKCYLTIIRETEDSMAVENYRANLSRPEEIALRQLGVHEQIENWRNT